MIQEIKYVLWRRMARKAVKEGKTLSCPMCHDPIVPGDFVGIQYSAKGSKGSPVHAGIHFSLSKRRAFCETGAVGCAVWDGTQLIGTGESVADKAYRTWKSHVG